MLWLARQSVVSSSGNSFEFQPRVPAGCAASVENITQQSPPKPKGCQIFSRHVLPFLEIITSSEEVAKLIQGRLLYSISSLPLWLPFRQLYVIIVQPRFI